MLDRAENRVNIFFGIAAFFFGVASGTTSSPLSWRVIGPPRAPS
jgi:hypothetical protein